LKERIEIASFLVSGALFCFFSRGQTRKINPVIFQENTSQKEDRLWGLEYVYIGKRKGGRTLL
jgi:hypothetical protein